MILRRSLMTVLAIFMIIELAKAENLYKVIIGSHREATRLKSCGIEPVLRVGDGFLILANEIQLAGSQLDYHLLASNIDRNELYVDNSREEFSRPKFPVIYEEGDLRLIRADGTGAITGDDNQIFPLPAYNISIEYKETASQNIELDRLDVPLDSLGELISKDSLKSYLDRLEAFFRRLSGSDSDRAARDWLHDKFEAFGYDSICYDSFPVNAGEGPAIGENVLVYKIGAIAPEDQIIIGAHRDAAAHSPGADDDGSGVAAVMEIARILKDIPTQVTIIFALFDGEEQWLVGSTHYANEAKARGDKIIMMLNMDMIGNTDYDLPDSNKAAIFYGCKNIYANLWIRLADSLYSLNGILSSYSNRGDHDAFVQVGYTATFVREYTWSPAYHSPRDSVQFLSLDYLTRMTKTSLLTTYLASETFQPNGELTFSFPAGPVIVATPWESTPVEVDVAGKYGDRPDPSAVSLHYSVNGSAYEAKPMDEISAGRFLAELPGAECSSRIEYFVTALDTVGMSFIFPDSMEPYRALVASNAASVFEDNFETDQGWTVSGDVTSGSWNRGIPVGGGDRGDPQSDFDGSGRCFATDTSDGDSDVDGGITYLVSPVMDLSGADALVHYARWYYNDGGLNPNTDTMKVFISNNEGIDWTPVEYVGPIEQASGGWYEHSFWARDFLPLTSKMRFMFTVRDVLSTIIEAAVDAFSIMNYRCSAFVCGDINGNGLVNILDATMLINYLYKGGRAPDRMAGADVNGDTAVNILDVTYLIGRLYKDGPAPVCL